MGFFALFLFVFNLCVDNIETFWEEFRRKLNREIMKAVWGETTNHETGFVLFFKIE